MRFLSGVVFCVAMSLAAAGVVRAEDALVVRVAVVDRDGRPQADASVFAKDAAGDVPLGRSDALGNVTITVLRGTPVYVRLGSALSEPVAVTSTSLRIAIGLPTIGSVTARPSLGSILLTAQSAAAIVSGDVTGALGFVPNYRTEAEGGSGAVQLNGTPLMLPSSLGGTSRFSIPSSLVSSFSPDQADDGTISPNLHLHAPTATPQRDVALAIGSQGLASWQTVFTGRVKKVGYAFVLADQGTGGKLFGRTFRDASGLTYDHTTGGHQLDGSADLEFQIGGAQVSVVALGSRSAGAQIGAVLPGTLAQGLGPGNLQATSFGDGYVRVARARGRDMWTLLDVRFGGAATDDDRNALIALRPIPSYTGYRFSGRYDELSFTRNFGPNSATAKLSSTLSTVVAFGAFGESAQPSSGTTLALSWAHTGKGSSLNLNVSGVRQTGPFSASRVNATLSGARWGPHARMDWSLYTAQAQLMETYYADSLRLAVPGAASFDCAGHSAFAAGPSDVTPGAPHVVAAKANVTQQIGSRTQITAGGFYAQTNNALVVAANSGALALPSGYLGALDANYANVCGAGALAPNDVFLTHYVTVPRRVGAEWYVSGSTSFGHVVVTAGYETYSVFATGLPAVPAGASSTLINGAQLWNVPMHRASAIIAYQRPSLTAALGLAYVSSNNAAHLPAYVTASAGVRAALRNGGALTFSAQNLFGRYADVFQSSRFAASSATTQSPVSFLATPLTPTWTLRYEFHAARQPVRPR